MTSRTLLLGGLLASALTPLAYGQTTPPPYKPGDYQTDNPNYHKRNPFYFEGKIDWELLGITVPADAWEFAQRGIHKQDDLEDIPGAISDYEQSLSLNSLHNGTCQLITELPAANINPPPCMFTVRLRLGHLLIEHEPEKAVELFEEVLLIDPLRLGVHFLIGEAYEHEAHEASDPAAKKFALLKALDAFKEELDLSPVTELSKQLTGDEANNSRAHWAMAEIYHELGQNANAADEYDRYLKATKWHSDTYPWRIELAKKRLGAH